MQQPITIIGTIVTEPVKRLVNDTVTVRLRVATSRRVRTPGENPEAPAEFIDRDQLYISVDCWDDLASHVAASVTKGSKVMCVGYLNTQEWMTEGEEKRSAIALRALHVGVDLKYQKAVVYRELKDGTTAMGPGWVALLEHMRAAHEKEKEELRAFEVITPHEDTTLTQVARPAVGSCE